VNVYLKKERDSMTLTRADRANRIAPRNEELNKFWN